MTPYYEHGGIVLYLGDCREVLPFVSADVLLTDPPYGFRKADWDSEFLTDWLCAAARATRKAMAIMPGVNNILRMPAEVGGFSYRWTLSTQLTNGMTRGLMGFGNWIPTLVYCPNGESVYRAQQDCAAVPVFGDMPDHPSPKPLRAVSWVLSRLPDGSVLDCFAGSGTTLVAAKQAGRRAIGIEREECYCELIARRLAQEVLPLT